jgi:hypothetical protein
VKGSLNLIDTQVAAELTAGGTFVNWIDGNDKNGNYIGLTCDPPSSYGSVKDTGVKVEGRGNSALSAPSPSRPVARAAATTRSSISASWRIGWPG